MLIARILKGWRKAEEINSRNAAEIVGLPLATYSRIENGRSVTAQTIIKLLLSLFDERKNNA